DHPPEDLCWRLDRIRDLDRAGAELELTELGAERFEGARCEHDVAVLGVPAEDEQDRLGPVRRAVPLETLDRLGGMLKTQCSQLAMPVLSLDRRRRAVHLDHRRPCRKPTTVVRFP